MRPSRIISLLAALVLTGAAGWADPPRRVVSINLCTDQLALALAAPGQLVSVTRLAQDPGSSALYDKARALPTNGSGAEEVYLLNPDLVLAGSYTDPVTLRLMRDLGIRVERFEAAATLDDIPALMAQMGAALGREAEAAEAIAAFRTELNLLRDTPARRPRAALYYVNSYTLGSDTLAGAILSAGGFDNIADEAGLGSGGTLPLERLVMMQPDVIVIGQSYAGQSRAEDNLAHPALKALTRTRPTARLVSRDWLCGTPQVLRAVQAMRDLRLSLGAEG